MFLLRVHCVLFLTFFTAVLQEVMREIDKNGDGSLDLIEFTSLVNSLIDRDFKPISD